MTPTPEAREREDWRKAVVDDAVAEFVRRGYGRDVEDATLDLQNLRASVLHALFRAPQPSVPSGEAVPVPTDAEVWQLWCAIEANADGQYDAILKLARVLLANPVAAPPQDRVSEAMVEAGVRELKSGFYPDDDDATFMRRILTAARAPSRTTSEGK